MSTNTQLESNKKIKELTDPRDKVDAFLFCIQPFLKRSFNTFDNVSILIVDVFDTINADSFFMASISFSSISPVFLTVTHSIASINQEMTL